MNNVRQLFKFWQRNVDVPRRGALQLFPSFHLVEVDLLSDFSSSDFQRFLVGYPALCYPFHSAPPAFLFSLAASKLFFTSSFDAWKTVLGSLAPVQRPFVLISFSNFPPSKKQHLWRNSSSSVLSIIIDRTNNYTPHGQRPASQTSYSNSATAFAIKALHPAFEWFCWEQIQRDFPTSPLRLFKVILSLRDTVRPPQIGRAFKIVIKTTAVQIDSADNSLPIVADKTFA